MSSNAIKCIQLMQSFKGIYQQAHLHLGRKLIKMYMPLNAKWFNNSVINVASLFSWFGHLNHLNEFNWIFLTSFLHYVDFTYEHLIVSRISTLIFQCTLTWHCMTGSLWQCTRQPLSNWDGRHKGTVRAENK